MATSLAIIGAGVSGTAAAWALRDAGLDVVLFEKSRGTSGRAATRRKAGCRYDHGANYFKTDSDRVADLVQNRLPTDELVDIGRDVWTFDGAGSLSEGDPAHNAAPKWTYRGGISTLGKLLHEASGARLATQTRIHHLEVGAAGDRTAWHLHSTEGEDLGTFDAVLVTPPAPQAADLLAESILPSDAQRRLVEALREGTYRTQLAVILCYDHALERPGDFYALLNTDGAHDVAWLSFEEDKPGHVPQGQSLLVAQMAPAWSEARYECDLERVAAEAASLASDLLRADAHQPAWTDVQRWRYALPNDEVDAATLAEAAPSGLFFAGDALAGQGRVARALETGLNAAEQIRTWLGRRAS